MNLQPGYYTSEDGTRRYFDGENWLEEERSEPKKKKKRPSAWSLAAGAAVFLVVSYFVGSNLDYESQLEQEFSKRANVVEAFFPQIASSCSVGSSNGFAVDEKRISMDGRGLDDNRGASLDNIACVLLATDVPDAVVSQIDGTSALQGGREASWDVLEGDAEIVSSWSYHPDSGLSMSLKLESVFQDEYFKEDHERYVKEDTTIGFQRILDLFSGGEVATEESSQKSHFMHPH